MEVFKTFWWKEMQTGKWSLRRIAGYIVVVVAALYNFRMQQSLLQELMYVGYGIYVVTFLKSRNTYFNMESLLSLPLTVDELCMSRTICNVIKILMWQVINVILFFIYFITSNVEFISGKIVGGFMAYHIALAEMIFISEVLLVLFGKKRIYAVLVFASFLLILVQIFIYSNSWIFNLCVQAILLCNCYGLHKYVAKVENDKVFGRWN